MHTQIWQSIVDTWAVVGFIGAAVGVTVGEGVSPGRSVVVGAAAVVGASMVAGVGAG
jgi:hypothetical protein